MIRLIANTVPSTQFVSPIETYFGFIVLGLMLSVGWLIIRRYGGPRKKSSGMTVEEALQEAEREAIRRKADREQNAPLAGLSPDQEIEQARLRRLLRQEENQQGERPNE